MMWKSDAQNTKCFQKLDCVAQLDANKKSFNDSRMKIDDDYTDDLLQLLAFLQFA